LAFSVEQYGLLIDNFEFKLHFFATQRTLRPLALCL
jgi:hypothetical protein